MKQTIRLFVLALVASIVVSIIYNRVTRDTEPAGIPTLVPTKRPDILENRVSVVMAEVNLEPYERPIEQTMVKKKKYPEKLLPRYAPLDIKDVIGKLPTEPIYNGEIISLARLVDKDEYKESLRRLIPPGYRALAVQVDALGMVAGFVSQGDVVDLASIYEQKLPGSVRGGRNTVKMAHIVLQNIKVLIVGRKYNPVYNDNEAGFIKGQSGSRPITFAVTTRDAAIIHHLSVMGKSSFRILLKNSEDREIVKTDGYPFARITAETLQKLRAQSDPTGTRKKREMKITKVVEVYRAGRKGQDEAFEERVKVQ